MERWQGRVAIVTGGSAGIGAAIALALAGNGLRVIAMARRHTKLEEFVSGNKHICKGNGELHAVPGDVSKEQDVKRVVKWAHDNLGGVDVLVNNAGVSYRNPLCDADSGRMQETFDVNFLGLCMMTREVIQNMRKRNVNDGHIFHISSVSGQRILNIPRSYIYAATKHAVRVMTEGLRTELRDMKTKIRVTEISPGRVRTEIMAAAGASPEEIEKSLRENPNLEPVDVAEALLYALGTPSHVQVHEITISPQGEKF